jgi:hypothetical protein
MISLKEWKAMSGKEQTLWLEENTELSRRSESQRGLVRGLGVNDSHYCSHTIIDGVKVVCPAYHAWERMLERSYSDKYHAKRPTYSGVTVCDEWKNFCAFRAWWIKNQVDGWQIDKDLLSDSGAYSPEVCVFVPAWLNSFTTDCGASRGEWPIGVCYKKGVGRFRALCGNPISKKQDHLGYFNTPEKAHLAWLTRKLELALELKPKMDSIDPRIYPRVVEIIHNAK